MAIQGLRGTGTFDVTNGMRPKNFREGILMLWPNGNAPLTGLTSAMKSESVDDPEFSWFEKSFAERRLTLGGNVSGVPTAGDADTIVLAGTNAYLEVKKGQLLMLEETSEVARVTANPTTNTISVIRGIGLADGTALTPITYNGVGINPKTVVMGTAHEEGDDTPTAIGYDAVKMRNYTQIFRDSLAFTQTAMKTRLRTGDQVKEARREALEMHSVDIERTFLWGQPSEIPNGGGGRPLRTTGGLLYFISAANVANPTLGIETDFGSTVNMIELEEALSNVFRYGSNEKVAFAGNRALLTIQQVIRKNTAWQFEGGKEFGMNVTRLLSPFGTLVLKTHPLFNVMDGGSTGGTAYNSWAASMMIIDMEKLRYRPLNARDTKYLPNRQANGVDGVTSEYLTECGFEVHHGKTHALWKNMASGVADA